MIALVDRFETDPPTFSTYSPGQFMNPGPAPRPPTDRPKLNLMPSTAGIPGNMSQLSLASPSVRSFGESSTSLSRATTLNDFNDTQGTGGVAIIREGPARVKDGLLWKQRWLVLRSFQLDFQKGQDGKVSSAIALKDVTAVGRSENTRLAFEITRIANTNSGKESALSYRDLPQKTTLCQLESDDAIYEWIDAIYSRCPGMGGVSNPTNFAHRVHVGFDPVNGAFVGLPTEWERLLTASAITKDDYKKHPEAVIEVLEFYSDITKRKENPDIYPSLTPTPPVSTKQNMQLGHGGGGTAIAPPRPNVPPAAASYTSQRSMGDSSSASRNGTPPGQRNASGSDPNQKLGMDADMRKMMEEEHRKVREAKEKRERERAAATVTEDEQNRKAQEAYNAAIPRTKTPLAKQELGGYGGSPEESRFNPTRTAPAAPSTDRPRQQPQGSLRGPPTTHRPAPQAPAGLNGSSSSAPKPPYAQKQYDSRDQSPNAQRALRTPQKPDQHRQPSPSTRIPINVADRKDPSPNHSRTDGGQPNGQIRAQPSSRLPGPSNQPTAPNVKQPVGAPGGKTEDSRSGQKQAEAALTKGTGATRQKEVRMSSMTEGQVMEKLKQVVSKDDPSLSYTKQKKIGQGASGSVYVAKINENAVSPVARRLYKGHNGRAQVAIKQMDLRNQPRKELIVNEIIVMKESSHPNIVNFLDSFLQESNNELWVVMEFMEGGALTDVIDNNPHITEAQISTICNEVTFPNMSNPRRHTYGQIDMQRTCSSTYAEYYSSRYQV